MRYSLHEIDTHDVVATTVAADRTFRDRCACSTSGLDQLWIQRGCTKTCSPVSLRLVRRARWSASRREARRMVIEKGVAFAEAAWSLAAGTSMKKVGRRYRSHVRANRRRLSR
jgi:hypothetical protein